MTIKASISMSDQQNQFARRLVEEGRFSSISAVVQHSLELLRDDTEQRETERALLRMLLEERANGPFLSAQDAQTQTQDLIAKKKADYGL